MGFVGWGGTLSEEILFRFGILSILARLAFFQSRLASQAADKGTNSHEQTIGYNLGPGRGSGRFVGGWAETGVCISVTYANG
jgi:hypothetical protein